MNVDTHRITRIADRGKTIPRAGTTITELLVACTIVGTLLTTTVPVLVRTGRLSRELSRHRLALDELSNQLDRLTLLPLDELKPSLNALTLDESVAAHLPEAELLGELVQEPRGHRLTLRLSWRRAATATPPAVLTAWIFPEAGGQAASEAPPSEVEALEEAP